MKMKKYLRNENGNIPFIPCFVVAMMVLLVSVMVYVTAEINCIHVRNTIKNELTNVAFMNVSYIIASIIGSFGGTPLLTWPSL